METVRELVPPKTRLVIYAVYIVAGLVIGSIAVATGDTVAWVEPAERVMAYLAVPLAVLAGVNVPESDPYVGRYRADDDPIGALTD